jgi:hypothetical protein
MQCEIIKPAVLSPPEVPGHAMFIGHSPVIFLLFLKLKPHRTSCPDLLSGLPVFCVRNKEVTMVSLFAQKTYQL